MLLNETDNTIYKFSLQICLVLYLRKIVLLKISILKCLVSLNSVLSKISKKLLVWGTLFSEVKHTYTYILLKLML